MRTPRFKPVKRTIMWRRQWRTALKAPIRARRFRRRYHRHKVCRAEFFRGHSGDPVREATVNSKSPRSSSCKSSLLGGGFPRSRKGETLTTMTARRSTDPRETFRQPQTPASSGWWTRARGRRSESPASRQRAGSTSRGESARASPRPRPGANQPGAPGRGLKLDRADGADAVARVSAARRA